jgi:6-phosphogluconolactonase
MKWALILGVVVMTQTVTLGSLRPAAAATYAYVGNADSNEVLVFSMDAKTGGMTLVEKVPLAGIAKAGPSTPMAVSPDKHTLFVGVRSQPFTVVSYAIDPKSGKLQHIGNGTLADSMAYIATDRSGKLLFSASYGGNKIAVNPIDAKGVVQAPSQVIPTGLNAHAIQADPSNRFVLATNLGSDVVLAFKLDAATGQLTPNQPPETKVAEKSGPRHFVFHPNGKFVYLVHELNAALITFGYDADKGQLSDLQHATALPPGFDGKPWAADIHITPDGRFLYASERTSSTLAGFRVDAATGQLATIGSVPTETQPRGFAIDPSGRFLAAVGELSDGMSVYTIDQTSGVLSKQASYPVGKKPNWVEFVAFSD